MVECMNSMYVRNEHFFPRMIALQSDVVEYVIVSLCTIKQWDQSLAVTWHGVHRCSSHSSEWATVNCFSPSPDWFHCTDVGECWGSWGGGGGPTEGRGHCGYARTGTTLLVILSVVLPVWILTHAPCSACLWDNDQWVLEYLLGPYCIFSSAIFNSSTYYLWLSTQVTNGLHDTHRIGHCEVITHSTVYNLYMLGMDFLNPHTCICTWCMS